METYVKFSNFILFKSIVHLRDEIDSLHFFFFFHIKINTLSNKRDKFQNISRRVETYVANVKWNEAGREITGGWKGNDRFIVDEGDG